MTNAITYPAAYNVLSCEEMTYTEGGVGVVEAAMAWFPLYGWYKAVSRHPRLPQGKYQLQLGGKRHERSGCPC